MATTSAVSVRVASRPVELSTWQRWKLRLWPYLHIHGCAHVLVIGTKRSARSLISQIQSLPESLFKVVACVDPDPMLAHGSVEGVPVVGTTAQLRDYLFMNPVDFVVVAMQPSDIADFASIMNSATELGLRVIVRDADLRGLAPEIATTEEFLGHPATCFYNVPTKRGYLVAKRILDLVLSAAGLLALCPWFLLIAALIKLTSRGPVFYPWKVLGTNKKPFTGYKFRTMVPDADLLKEKLRDQNHMSGPVFKMKDDPRITPIGNFLRKYSIDELPQLYSVLKGDMSLVGPRPPAKHEADEFEFWQRRKLSVKPGITCIWQVSGRNEITDFADWARLDLKYIQQASFILDVKILARTIPAVLGGDGAY